MRPPVSVDDIHEALSLLFDDFVALLCTTAALITDTSTALRPQTFGETLSLVIDLMTRLVSRLLLLWIQPLIQIPSQNLCLLLSKITPSILRSMPWLATFLGSF